MKASSILFVLILVIGSSSAIGQQFQTEARKFDEFTAGIGSPEYRYGNWEEHHKEIKRRLALYGQALRKAGARPYAITYSPRVVPWEIYDRSIAESRAGALWQLTPLADWRDINIVNGGFREVAATELWIVPPGAQPPCPTPTVRPENVVYCPSVRIAVVPYVPDPVAPIRLEAQVNVNRARIEPVFDWSISQGEIITGQGTDSITVKVAPGSEGELTARVTLRGFSLECSPESTTSTSRTAFGVRHYLFDEFGDIRMGDEKARLDNLAVTLQEHPALQAHIVFYGGRSGPPNEAMSRAARAKDYLVAMRGMEADRVLIVDGGYRNEVSGEYWLSKRGTGTPAVRPMVDSRFVKPVVRGRAVGRTQR